MDTVVVEVPEPLWAQIRERVRRRRREDTDFSELLNLLKHAPAVGIRFDRKEAHRH